MLARRGVAACILVSLVLAPLVAHAAGVRLDARTVGLAMLLGLAAAVFLAGEAMPARRRPLSGAPKAVPLPADDAGQPQDALRPTGIDEQVALLSTVLQLARPAPAVERLTPVDVAALVAELVAQKGSPCVRVAGRQRPIYALASREALARALEILIENALASGTRAEVSLDCGTSALVVHVDDDGPGVPKRLRAEVLAWHYHMATPSSQQTGCKAEVVIARQILRAHGGEIVVGSSPLGGARFTARLPLLASDSLTLAEAS